MDRKIKVIIAEDNIDAQEIISEFMKPLEPFEVIGVAHDGESLVDLHFRLKPDLVIADIDMPKVNGLEAIRSCLKVNSNLKFIYTTAYDQYAVKAFDLNAVDYVLKPIKKERLYVALDKAKDLLMPKIQIGQKEILPIKMDRISHFIPFSKVICIEKENRKSVIHTAEQIYETNESLDSISRKLNTDFFRTHRSFIINIDWISHITIEGETYFAFFRNYPHYAHVSKLRLNELYKALTYSAVNSE